MVGALARLGTLCAKFSNKIVGVVKSGVVKCMPKSMLGTAAASAVAYKVVDGTVDAAGTVIKKGAKLGFWAGLVRMFLQIYSEVDPVGYAKQFAKNRRMSPTLATFLPEGDPALMAKYDGELSESEKLEQIKTNPRVVQLSNDIVDLDNLTPDQSVEVNELRIKFEKSGLTGSFKEMMLADQAKEQSLDSVEAKIAKIEKERGLGFGTYTSETILPYLDPNSNMAQRIRDNDARKAGKSSTSLASIDDIVEKTSQASIARDLGEMATDAQLASAGLTRAQVGKTV